MQSDRKRGIKVLKLTVSGQIDRIRVRAPQPEHALKTLAWMAVSGVLYCLSSATLRGMSMHLNPYQTSAMQYGATLLVMLAFIMRSGAAKCRPRDVPGLLLRGGMHWLATCIWPIALIHIALPKTIAIGFTVPLFIMAGGSLVLKERFRWERAVAALVGLCGVLVVMGPRPLVAQAGRSQC